MEPVRPIPPSVGGRLALGDIIGRDDDVERFWRMLRTTSDSLLLTEPRRLGKSATLRLMCDRCPDGWHAVYLQLQAVNTVAEMADQFLSALATHQRLGTRMRHRLRGWISGIGVTHEDTGVSVTLGQQFRLDPVSALSSMLTSVGEELGDDHLVIVCDEAPDMIAAIAETEGPGTALAALSMWRTERGSTSKVRWVVTGSVGFHHVLRRLGHKDDRLNDLAATHLGPLTPAATRWLAASVLLGAGIAEPDEAAVEEVARLSSGFAIIVHLVGAQLRDQAHTTVSAEDIEPILRQAFSNQDQSHQFTSFLTRLNSHYGDDTRGASWLLDELANGAATRQELLRRARKAKTFTDEEHLREILRWLELDHYLTRDDNDAAAYSWRYEALCRLWAIRRR